jgi:hypothetical protein
MEGGKGILNKEQGMKNEEGKFEIGSLKYGL